MSLPERLRPHPRLDGSARYAAIALQLVTAAGLAYDAKIHLDLAPTYDAITSSTISQGDLFRIEGALAIAAAVLVVLVRRPVSAAFAFLVAGGGLVPLLVYRYYDIGAIGPLPSMYEPGWYPDKTHTCIAQAIAAATALALLALLVVAARKISQKTPIRSSAGTEPPA